jgi:hypothetical protein
LVGSGLVRIRKTGEKKKANNGEKMGRKILYMFN